RAHHDARAECFQHELLLAALLVAHREHGAVALDRGGHREANTRVAARAFDHGAAGLELPRLLGRFDERGPDAVLDRAARVHELALREHERPDAFGDAVEPHERRVADGPEDALVVLHAARSAPAPFRLVGQGTLSARSNASCLAARTRRVSRSGATSSKNASGLNGFARKRSTCPRFFASSTSSSSA